MTTPVTTTSTTPRYICFLCKRKFKSAALLTRHKQLSDLHGANLQKQDEDMQRAKEELRQSIASVRKQIQEAEGAKEGQGQRTALELKLRQALGEYGQAQEKLEASRLQQLAERAGGNSPAHLKRSEAHETSVGRLVVSVGAASWQGNKDVQEDRFMVDVELEAPEGKRVVGFVVLDGHSGNLCVDALMDWLPRNLQKCLSAKPSLTEEHLRQAVTEACVLTDDEFLAKAREREVLDGSTMLLCLVYPDDCRRGLDGVRTSGHCRLLIANLGDSRAVLCRSQGGRISAVRLSDDHKPGRADERRRIEAKGGVVDMQGVWRVFTPGPATFGGRNVLWGLAVSRAFGDLLMKEPQRYGCTAATGELVTAVPEIHTYDLHPAEDRFLILACDGIWDVLGDDDAVAVCIEHRSADLAAHALTRRAFEMGSDDNLTAMIIAWQVSEAELEPKEGRDAKKITTLLLQKANGTDANQRTIPFEQVHKICQHHPILPPAAFQGNNLKLRVDDLCVALLLKDGQMLSFSFESEDQRKTFAWCISSFVDGQKKKHRVPASGHKVTPRSQRHVPESKDGGSAPESRGFIPYDFGLEDDETMSLPVCQDSPVPTLPVVEV